MFVCFFKHPPLSPSHPPSCAPTSLSRLPLRHPSLTPAAVCFSQPGLVPGRPPPLWDQTPSLTPTTARLWRPRERPRWWMEIFFFFFQPGQRTTLAGRRSGDRRGLGGSGSVLAFHFLWLISVALSFATSFLLNAHQARAVFKRWIRGRPQWWRVVRIGRGNSKLDEAEGQRTSRSALNR